MLNSHILRGKIPHFIGSPLGTLHMAEHVGRDTTSQILCCSFPPSFIHQVIIITRPHKL